MPAPIKSVTTTKMTLSRISRETCGAFVVLDSATAGLQS